jgi:hypothetical protein
MTWALVTRTESEPNRRTVDYFVTRQEAVGEAIGRFSRGAANRVNGEIILCQSDLRPRLGEDWYFQSCLGHVSLGFHGAAPSMPSVIDGAKLALLLAA